MNGDLRNTSQYADNNVEYYMEKCTPEYLIPNANPTAVEDGSRSNEGGFFNSIMNFFGVGEGSKGSQQ